MQKNFRDKDGQDVLLFIDNIFRFTQEDLKYQLTWKNTFSRWLPNQTWQQKWELYKKELHQQNLVLSHQFQAVYVPADDLTDPAPATTFSHLDATTVLSRNICISWNISSC